MQNKHKVLIVLAALLGGFSYISANAYSGYFSQAQGGRYGNGANGKFGQYRQAQFERRQENFRQFIMGICVGQTLSEQGVSFPAPEPGQPFTLDSATQAALQSAVQTCREQLEGDPSSPTPSPVPSAAPTAVPTAVPTANPSGVPAPVTSSNS